MDLAPRQTCFPAIYSLHEAVDVNPVTLAAIRETALLERDQQQPYDE